VSVSRRGKQRDSQEESEEKEEKKRRGVVAEKGQKQEEGGKSQEESKEKEERQEKKREKKARVGVSYEGLLTHALGIRFTWYDMRVRMDQHASEEALIRHYRMWDAKPAKTPMETGLVLNKVEGESTADDKRRKELYQSLVGSLLYIARCTRADIQFAVTTLCRFTSAPSEGCWIAAKRVLRYLRGTMQLVLEFDVTNQYWKRQVLVTSKQWTKEVPLYVNLEGDAVASFNSTGLNGRSILGYIIRLEGSCFIHSSSVSATAAQSSMEAELLANNLCLREIMWVRNILEEIIGEDEELGATPIAMDNEPAIFFTENPVTKKRSKHFDPKLYLARSQVSEGKAVMVKRGSDEMVSDGLSKALGFVKFIKFRAMLGMVDVEVTSRRSSDDEVCDMANLFDEALLSV